MHYEGNIVRPPSEANSILLQITTGCSHNKCTFCGTFKGERFKIKPDDVIMEDIAFAEKYCRRQRRLFLCGGDALIVPQKRLVKILQMIRERLPWVTRIGIYGNAKGIKMKSIEDLEALRDLGVGIVYMGVESGDDVTLRKIRKGASAAHLIAMGKKALSTGMKLSITVLLGVAGRDRSQVHAEETGKVLSAIDPNYVGALSLMLVPGTPLMSEYEAGIFELPDSHEMLNELRAMIANTHLTHGLFHANHASNYLPIKARLPKDKEKTLELIDQALSGKIALKPEYLRAL